jgi:hypothetical protein
VSASTEIAKLQVSHIDAAPALPGIGALLDQYMWVHTLSSTPMTDIMTGRTWTLLSIQGNIKPDLEASDARSLRRGFAESFEAVIAILDEAGATWERHPFFSIAGKVRRERDGSQSFASIEARVDITLVA